MVSECGLEVILEIFPSAAVIVGRFMQHLNWVSISAVHALYSFKYSSCYQKLLESKKYKTKKKKKPSFSREKWEDIQINTSVTR